MHKKGPDVMSKSKQSQQRYAKSWIGQTRLDEFFTGSSQSQVPSQQPVIDIDAASDIESDTIELINTPEAALDQPSTHTIPIIPQSRRTSERDTDSQSDSDTPSRSELPENVTRPPSSAAVSENESDNEGSEDAAKDWEHELDEAVQRPPAEIKDWGALRTQIKEDLKKRSKILTLSAINQLMILSNFATLRLKGASRIAASEEIARQWHEGEGKYFA